MRTAVGSCTRTCSTLPTSAPHARAVINSVPLQPATHVPKVRSVAICAMFHNVGAA